MSKVYSESSPHFVNGFDAVVIVADGLISAKLPWEHEISTARYANRLRESGIRISLTGLGRPDPFQLAESILAEDSSVEPVLASVLAEMEMDWALSAKSSAVAGLRELTQHLVASQRTVVIMSGLDASVAQRVVTAAMGRTIPYPVVGRRSLKSIEDVYDAAFAEALKIAGSNVQACTIAAATAHPVLPPTMIGDSLIIVGGHSRIDDPEAPDIVDLAVQCDLTSAERTDLEKRIARRDRIRHLRLKKTLSNAEMAEYTDLTGGVRLIGNTESFGYIDRDKGMQNASLLRARKASAAASQYLLEVISTDAMLLEIELRNWLIIHHDGFFEQNTRITFGQLVDKAERFGLSTPLAERLRRFNSVRNDAIHHLARGVMSYYELTDAYMEHCSLLSDLEDYVLEAAPVIGRPAEHY